MSSIAPLWGNVLVRLDAKEDKTAGGLYIPDPAQTKKVTGTVLAVGPGRQTDSGQIALETKPGDHVVFGRFLGYTVPHEGEDLYMIQDKFIEAVYTSAEENSMIERHTMTLSGDKRYEYLSVEYVLTADEFRHDVDTDAEVSTSYPEFAEKAQSGWVPFEWEVHPDHIYVTRLHRQVVDIAESSDPHPQEVRAELAAAPHTANVTPANLGQYQVMTLNLVLYLAEENEPNNPEWKQFRELQAEGWEVDAQEEVAARRIIRGLKRRVS